MFGAISNIVEIESGEFVEVMDDVQEEVQTVYLSFEGEDRGMKKSGHKGSFFFSRTRESYRLVSRQKVGWHAAARETLRQVALCITRITLRLGQKDRPCLKRYTEERAGKAFSPEDVYIIIITRNVGKVLGQGYGAMVEWWWKPTMHFSDGNAPGALYVPAPNLGFAASCRADLAGQRMC